MLVLEVSLPLSNFKEGAGRPSTWVFPFLKGKIEAWKFFRVLPSPGELLLAQEGSDQTLAPQGCSQEREVTSPSFPRSQGQVCLPWAATPVWFSLLQEGAALCAE